MTDRMTDRNQRSDVGGRTLRSPSLPARCNDAHIVNTEKYIWSRKADLAREQFCLSLLFFLRRFKWMLFWEVRARTSADTLASRGADTFLWQPATSGEYENQRRIDEIILGPTPRVHPPGGEKNRSAVRAIRAYFLRRGAERGASDNTRPTFCRATRDSIDLAATDRSNAAHSSFRSVTRNSTPSSIMASARYGIYTREPLVLNRFSADKGDRAARLSYFD